LRSASDAQLSVAVGFSIPADTSAITLCAPVFAAADYGEVLPESLVAPTDSAAFRGNGMLRQVAELQQRRGFPLVAHGTGLSLAGTHPLDADRTARWLARAAALQERLGFGWYTDHLGLTAPAGLALALPLGVPATSGARDATRARLRALAAAVRVPVGVENSVIYAPLADPRAEPAFLAEVVGVDHALLLDVHNLWVHVCNFGLDVDAWLAAAPLDRVIEIHVSGGREADPAWTSRPWRLDGHDTPVPEAVWALLDRVLPLCPGLRGVTLERLEGTVAPHEVDGLVAEVERVRAAIARRAAPVAPPRAPTSELPPGDVPELALADAWTSRDPEAALRRLAADEALPAAVHAGLGHALAHRDGIGLTRRILLRLRFERLLRGSGAADAWFERDPADFARAFTAYVEEVPPVAFLPSDEADLFRRFLGERGA
jgi:uncharacterized protein (UPF0276 family)